MTDDLGDHIQVSADGCTVWIHANDGSTVGRFSTTDTSADSEELSMRDDRAAGIRAAVSFQTQPNPDTQKNGLDLSPFLRSSTESQCVACASKLLCASSSFFASRLTPRRLLS